MILTLRTTVGRENVVIESLRNKIKNSGLPIKAVLRPGELKGYIFVEGEVEDIERIMSGVPHIRGIIRKQVKMSDISKFLETKKIEIKVKRGDIIEISSGPFKNEKGKVTRVDEAKHELTLELLEAAIPIPITVSIDSVRVLEAAEESK